MLVVRVGIVLAAAVTTSGPAWAQQLADGNDWSRASADQRYAYIAGISDVVSAGARYDQKHAPTGTRTFMLQAQAGFSGTTIEQAVQTVDAWYRANPGELNKPVLSVIWREIAKPRLPAQ